MSYLKYSNLCAEMLRASLKEPFKSQAKVKEVVYFRSAVWKDGKPEKQGMQMYKCEFDVQIGFMGSIGKVFSGNWDPMRVLGKL